jgi:hypothetical protein
VSLIHKRIEFVSAALGVTLTNFTYCFSRYNYFIASDTSRLVATNASRDTITYPITRTIDWTASNTAKGFHTCVAATVTHLRHRAGVEHKGSIG